MFSPFGHRQVTGMWFKGAGLGLSSSWSGGEQAGAGMESGGISRVPCVRCGLWGRVRVH